jgi:hypothetical protein
MRHIEVDLELARIVVNEDASGVTVHVNDNLVYQRMSKTPRVPEKGTVEWLAEQPGMKSIALAICDKGDYLDSQVVAEGNGVAWHYLLDPADFRVSGMKYQPEARMWLKVVRGEPTELIATTSDVWWERWDEE